MTKIPALVVSAALAIGIATPAPAGVNDPEVIIYRFPGVRDTGGADNSGVATSFHCTNFSGATESVRMVIRNDFGGLITNVLISIDHLQTITRSTKLTVAYTDISLGSGFLAQGTIAIAATSMNVICTAMTIDASTVAPVGVALRGIRFSPVPGSQE